MDDQEDRLVFLRERNHLTRQLLQSPYSCITYIRRAIIYERLGYPDLAVGDAYRALLLTDEIADDSGEYHQQALETYESDIDIGWPQHAFWVKTLDAEEHEVAPQGFSKGDEPGASSPSRCRSDEEQHSNDDIVHPLRLKCYACLSDYLRQCGCLRNAYDYAERGLQLDPGSSTFLHHRRKATQTYNRRLLEKDPNWTDWTYDPLQELPDKGYARRELYPWNEHEPDRFSKESLAFLNQEMKRVAPKCEIRVVSLPVLDTSTTSQSPSKPSATNKQLGVFAKEDIAPHETVLQERSLLTANNRLHDPLCDACSAALPSISALREPLPTCPDCDDTIFCSETCYSLATSLYHPAVCGKPEVEAIAKDPSPSAATNALYLLLLGRTFTLSETQSIHPLNLPETKYLWGDFTPPEQPHLRELPFTLEDNILAPLHLLTKMDVDIFASLATTDIWIISTLFAKFRGVASARMNPRTGMPEVCAVHPMWCLANHSCAPNVKWEWSGEIKFEARGGEDVVRWGVVGDRERKGGIRKGEEVLNHYCDVGSGVKERREWAIGALGGNCVCERCIWEEGVEERKKGKEKTDEGAVDKNRIETTH
ncbi:MAG: hypothetical protein L6R40_002436 [Gallowayella cf. fulva]|nr:MAG: hypothetical protein L6R40_002436 [Xanthomendoza cf. fulva]